MAASFLKIAFDSSVRKRALRIALIVGTILAAINHGDNILMGAMDQVAILKCALTYFVPYVVSTYSSVLAVRDQQQTLEDT